jgi:hypothetical protein
VGLRLSLICGLALVITVGGAHARDIEMGGDGQYSIMAPEPGTATHHRVKAETRKRRLDTSSQPEKSPTEKSPAREAPQKRLDEVRGSSGSVLPTPLPRTTLIPPEGSGRLTEPALPRQQGPSIVPGVVNSVPNLPHGTETFQDRAARCTFQSSLYGVPGGARTQYMGSCVQ